MLDPSGGLFSDAVRGPVSACSPTLRKRGTRKSRLETKPENDASSALPVRLWCHLPLQKPANCAENLIRLCSATIGQTGWRMVQFGAIRSRLVTMNNREKQGNWAIFVPIRPFFDVVTLYISNG